MPTTLLKRGTTRSVAVAAAPRPTLADEGIVVAIVAVTGTEDSVRDIVAPGAFAATLRARRPKLAWMHDWHRPLGRVLSIAELKPGDKRLPKILPDGRRWPAAAGALIATMQFNLATRDGRDFFEHAKAWAINGEAAFSIGYKVPDGMSSKRADGVRIIYGLELYEVSLVLHGAHDMALALEVKDAETGAMLDTRVPQLEHKDTEGIIPAEAPAAAPAQPDFSDSAMIALYPDTAAADKIAADGGLEPGDLHVTVAYLGKGTVDEPYALAARIGPAVAAVGPLDGFVGGLGQFPPGPDGTPVWAPVDVPGIDRLRLAVTDALDDAGSPQQSTHGFTPHMTLGYNLPDPQPVAKVPVTFNTAYLVVGGNRYPLPLSRPDPPLEAKALVANLARQDGRHGLAAYLEAKSAQPGAAPPEKKSTPTTAQEMKAMAYMTGSYEEQRHRVQNALEDLLCPKSEHKDGEVGGWVCIDAMFPDHVIASRHNYKGGDDETFRVTYTLGAEDVALGKPSSVELSLVAVPDDGAAPAPQVEAGPDLRLRFLDPATAALDGAVRYVGALPEGKGHEELHNPLMRLLDTLAAKGYDVAGAVLGEMPEDEHLGYEDEDAAEPIEPDPDADADAEGKGGDMSSLYTVVPDDAPAEEEKGADPDAEDEEELDDAEVDAPAGDVEEDKPSGEMVTLDPDEVRQKIESLRG